MLKMTKVTLKKIFFPVIPIFFFRLFLCFFPIIPMVTIRYSCPILQVSTNILPAKEI